MIWGLITRMRQKDEGKQESVKEYVEEVENDEQEENKSKTTRQNRKIILEKTSLDQTE